MTTLTKRLRSYRAAVVRFHRNERGMEAMQVVVILALAVLILNLTNKAFSGADGTQEASGGSFLGKIFSGGKALLGKFLGGIGR